MKTKEYMLKNFRFTNNNALIEKWLIMLFQSAFAGLFMGYIAIHHNPQEEYRSLASGIINVVPVFVTALSWFIGVLLLNIILNGASKLMIWGIRKLYQNEKIA